MPRPAALWKKLAHFWQREIWRPEHLLDRSLRGQVYAILRVISISTTGLIETKSASRAAALSFSSLLGLGPLVALVVLVAGFVLDRGDPNLAVNTLNRVIQHVAPQIVLYEVAPPAAGAADGTAVHPAATPPAGLAPGKTAVAVNPEMVKLINGFVAGSRNGTAGTLGALTLIVIVLQLFSSIENAFNEIWGVRRGRSLLMRIVFYWTVLTLGAVLFFAVVTGLSANAFMGALSERLHLGPLLRVALPPFSILVLIAVLTLFYRYIPNTTVWWRGAFVGAVAVAVLLVLNNYLAFLYISRVRLQQSLYGSLGLLPILMAGLYVFWLFVLVGGQISYAVQNVHFRNSQAAWGGLAGAMRQRLSLLVLLTVGRRFQGCQPPCTAEELGDQLKVPMQLLNECLNRLVQLELISPVPPPADSKATEFQYQPARPLNRITLGGFKQLDDNFGDSPAGASVAELDPLVRAYHDALQDSLGSDFFQQPLDRLLADHPLPARDPRAAPPRRFRNRRLTHPPPTVASAVYLHDHLDPENLPAALQSHLCRPAGRHHHLVYFHDRGLARHRPRRQPGAAQPAVFRSEPQFRR